MPKGNDDDDYPDYSNTDEYADGYDENGPIDDKVSNEDTDEIDASTSEEPVETSTASSGSEAEESTKNPQEMIKLYLNGLQAYTKEPALKSRMDEGVQSLKDQIISMSSSVQRFSEVDFFNNFGHHLLKRETLIFYRLNIASAT
jgi:hypothetical protein